MNTSLPRVLVTDDDATVLKALEHFFIKQGWSSCCVPDGSAGLDALHREHFNLVVTDLQMPKLDGFQFIRRLKNLYPDQAVIVLSAGCTAEEAVDLLREGVADVIYKPVDFEALRKSIKRVTSDLEEREQKLGWAEYITSWTMNYRFETRELIDNKLPVLICESLLKAGKINLKCKFQIDLALSEALTNSLQHGNLELCSAWREEVSANGVDRYSAVKEERIKQDKYAKRKIHIKLAYAEQKLSIEISDQGPGFTPPDLKTIEVNSDSKLFCHGRGIALIKELMDEVEYSKDGRTIRIVKNLRD